MKRVLSLILIVVTLGACGQQNDENNKNSSHGERDEGIIVNVEKEDDGRYLILTLPSVENINIVDKTRDELIKLAQENDGAFYKVSQEKYEELGLDIGKRIVGYYDAEFESDPPLRITDKIELISQ
ncbi:hypothetical protein [Ornithinibacillus californiensis]|uniref:hypothetical protein n=1 Tax=Ornithinibacillus californiensis TaxID=161536 RepID=UPI00064DE221|nr:hypothetical protein [Ornithinibacillus californiensis]